MRVLWGCDCWFLHRSIVQAIAHTLCELVIHSSVYSPMLDPGERELVLAHLLATSATISTAADAPGAIVRQRIEYMRGVLPRYAAVNKGTLVRALVPAARRTIAAGVDRSASATLVRETRRQLAQPVASSLMAVRVSDSGARGGDGNEDGDDDGDDGAAALPEGDDSHAALVCLLSGYS